MKTAIEMIVIPDQRLCLFRISAVLLLSLKYISFTPTRVAQIIYSTELARETWVARILEFPDGAERKLH